MNLEFCSDLGVAHIFEQLFKAKFQVIILDRC